MNDIPHTGVAFKKAQKQLLLPRTDEINHGNPFWVVLLPGRRDVLLKMYARHAFVVNVVNGFAMCAWAIFGT